uniref:Uncharacterized protein n=1 Tax=Glossina morsitans morsitans TaxID=37546 RepID=A0A1B0FAR3_GLOMM
MLSMNKNSTYCIYGGVTAAALAAQNAKQNPSVQIEDEDDDNSGDDVEEVATRKEIDRVADEEEQQLSLELNWTISESLPEENRCREKFEALITLFMHTLAERKTTKEAIKKLSHFAFDFVIRLHTKAKQVLAWISYVLL